MEGMSYILVVETRRTICASSPLCLVNVQNIASRWCSHLVFITSNNLITFLLSSDHETGKKGEVNKRGKGVRTEINSDLKGQERSVTLVEKRRFAISVFNKLEL